jgi:hypothetical protein
LINKYDYILSEDPTAVECDVVSYGRNSVTVLTPSSGSFALLAAYFLLATFLFYSFTLKMEAIYSSRKVDELLEYTASDRNKIIWNLRYERIAL